jgi:macrolide transport system ATP-binding/permease protein
MLLTVSNLTKYFGAELILNDLSFVVNANERVGLVGANGVGKSTLLKLITGQLQPDSGAIAINPKTSVGYLPQVIAGYADKTLDELLLDLQGNLTQLTAQLRQLEAQMATANGETLAQLMQSYGDLSEQFEQAGGYELDHRVDEVFAGLDISHLPRQRAVSTLSGGEKERVGLAALLLRSPNLLLLDEPTNHLDFAALAWLEAYLKNHKGGLLVVSHDRQFLNNTVSVILEIDEYTRGLKTYTGNYEAYLVARERSRAQWAIDYETQQEEIKELRKQVRADAHYGGFWKGGGKGAGDKFAKGFFKGRAAVATSRRVHNAEERLARIEEDPIPKPPDEIRISPEFSPAELEGKTPLRVVGLRKAFGARALFDGVTFDLKPSDRIVITGPNGCGKSTLLRIIAGELQADAGEVTLSHAARVGYLDQEQTALTNLQTQTQTAFEWWREGLKGDEEMLRAEFFRFFLLTYEDAQKPIAALSIGQRRKLQLLKLIAERANLLLLDEPTNHISFDVMEKFEQALHEFNGPILAVSHDRRFIERFGGEVWELSTNLKRISG